MLVQRIQILLFGLIVLMMSACSTVDNGASNIGGKTFELISDPQDLKITILFDNYVFNDQLTAEWGFSALIEYGDNTILFYAGTDGEILLDNISKLGIDSHTIDALVISHNHADHTGGIQSLLNQGITPLVYLLGSFSSDI